MHSDKHYSVPALAKLWGMSSETVRQLFRNEPGVLKIVRPETRNKRGYVTLFIPESVARRKHAELSGLKIAA